jgi:hypothetical protein
MRRNKVQMSGDNIYSRTPSGVWNQLASFHSHKDGSPDPRHIGHDTKTNRVLIGDMFVYFGGEGPKIPTKFRNYNGLDICKAGIGLKIFDEPVFIQEFLDWINSTGAMGYAGRPLDWVLKK